MSDPRNSNASIRRHIQALVKNYAGPGLDLMDVHEPEKTIHKVGPIVTLG